MIPGRRGFFFIRGAFGGSRAAVDGELALQADGGGGDERDARERARVGDEVPRPDVIGAVQHAVAVGDELERVFVSEAVEVRLHDASRVEPAKRGLRGHRLGDPPKALAVDDLAVEVRDLDVVGVREGESTDARGGQVQRRGGAEAADADDQHLGAGQRRLLRGAEGGEGDVPRVPLEVRAGEDVVRARGRLPRPEVVGERGGGRGGTRWAAAAASAALLGAAEER